MLIICFGKEHQILYDDPSPTAMDARRNIFDSVKDQIWQDLGPLDPNWFEELTVKASSKDQGDTEREHSSTAKSCGQDGSFKILSTLDSSDMFSTPKVFRHRKLQSPESLIDKEPFPPDQVCCSGTSGTGITDTSPCLFGTSVGSETSSKPCRTTSYGEHFGLLDMPNQMAHSAKRISESLGAELDADISWTSSLNTPVMSPTIILTKSVESRPLCPVKPSAGDQVMFVRNLFPSLSKESESAIPSLEINNRPLGQQVGRDGQLTGVFEMSVGSQDTLPGDESGLWKQTIPNVFEDREIRSTVASVLDGAEDVLSMFFSNSSLALRRVRAKERIKRKQSVSTRLSSIKEHIPTDNMEHEKVSCKRGREYSDTSATSESRTEIKSGDLGISQWTPISLSEISDFMDTFHYEGTSSMKHIIAHGAMDCAFLDSTGSLQPEPGSSKRTVLVESALSRKTVQGSSHPDGFQLKRSAVGSSPEHTFARKTRTFVYGVQNQPSSKQGKHSVSQMLLTSHVTPPKGNNQNINNNETIPNKQELNTGNLKNTGMDGNNQLVHQESATDKKIFSQAPTKDPVFDMSQLCKVFAQDFSQAVEFSKPCSRREEAIQNGFSASAGLSTVKQTKRKLTKLESGPKTPNYVTRDVMHTTNITKVTDTSVLKQALSCETGSPPTTEMNFISPLNGATVSKQSSVKFNGQVCVPCGSVSGFLQPDCGFKTNSKMKIHISSASLEKAKKRFKQIDDERVAVNCSGIGLNEEGNMSSGLMLVDESCLHPDPYTHKMTFESKGLLTASQRADVSELCSLLEDADSQFEFTQFKSAKHTTFVSTASSDKDLDPDLLTGIDFNDSFNSDIEKQSLKMVTPEKNTIVSQCKRICQVTSSDNKSLPISSTEKPIEHVLLKRALSIHSSSSEKIAKSSFGLLTKNTTRKHLDNMKKNTSEKQSDSKHLKCGISFKTAEGNAMAVSEKCLSKAKALFADLEEVNETNTNACAVKNTEQVEASPVKCKSEIDSNNKISSFTSNNKNSYEKKGDVNELCDKYIDKMEVNFTNSHKHTDDDDFQTASAKAGTISDCASKEQKNKCGFTTARGKRVYVSPASLLKARTLLNDCDELDNSKPGKIPSLYANISIQNIKQKSYFGFQKPCSKAAKIPMTAKNELNRGGTSHDIRGQENKMLELDNSQINVNNSLQNGCDFCTASGERECVPYGALLKAEALFSDCNVDGEELSKSMLRVDCTIPIQNSLQKQNGFKCVNGKGVTVSTKALQHAMECNTIVNAEINQENWAAKPTDVVVINSEKSNCGFMTAGGQKVVSEKGLLKARSILNDNLDENCPYLEKGFTKESSLFEASKWKSTDDLNTDCHTNLIHELPVKHGQFRTASGKGVIVSTKALQQAKGIFTDCDFIVNADAKPQNSPEKHPDIQKNNQEKSSCGFITAGGKKLHVSEKCILKARSILNENLDNCKYLEKGFTNNSSLFEPSQWKSKDQPETHCEFKSASGKGVTLSVKALQQVKALFNDCNSNMDSLISAAAKQENSEIKSADSLINSLGKSYCAFMTAGGKNVHISDKGILKAKSILYENLDDSCTNAIENVWVSDRVPLLTEDGTDIKHGARNKSNSSGIRGVEKSCDWALQKPESLLNEWEVVEYAEFENGLKVDVENIPIKEQNQISSFSTTHRNEVSVSEKGFEDVKFAYSPSGSGDNPVRSPCFSTASGKSVSVSENALQEPSANFKECVDDTLACYTNLHKSPEEKRRLKVPNPTIHSQCELVKADGLKDPKVIQTSVKVLHLSSLGVCKESSLSNLESLGLSSCSVTQKSCFAKKAMDCPKALLEAEDLTNQSPRLPEQARPMSCKGTFPVRSGTGKRQAADVKIRDEPPLKRRLLDEFDRTVDCNRRSSFSQVKSSSDGTFKDRRVFKYNVALQPNVTRQYRKLSLVAPRLNKNEPQITSDSTTKDIKPVSSKTIVFVPPFWKNIQPEPQRSSGCQDKAKASVVFVPPFRKGNHETTEGFSKSSEDKTSPLVFERGLHTESSVPLPEYNHIPVNDTSYDKANKSVPELNQQRIEETEAGRDGWSRRGVEAGTAKESKYCQPAPNCTDVAQDTQCLQLARDMQDIRIRKKMRQTIRPLPGSLYLAKTSGLARRTLRNAVRGQHPEQHTVEQLFGYGVHLHVAEISSENAEAFRFVCRHHFSSKAFIEGRLQLGDGAWLIPRDDGTAGKYEFYRALCDSPGVDPKLISEDWVFNHYRWVVWKKACMERAFPQVMGSLCLTPEQVLLQLKYRYDVEVDHSRRSALRKIMERDDNAAKTMVLCVCGIVTKGHNPTRLSWSETKTPQSAAESSPVAVILLTDGWYAIKTQLDFPLTAMLHRGRLRVGGKLVVHGAELVGSQDACSPLEAPDSLMLKIRANSTRVARWDIRLGFYRDPRPFLLPLSSLYSSGGPVGCVDIVVLRSYPTQWMEKKLDGGFVFRSQRAEETEQQRHEQAENRAREILCAKIQAQIEKEEDAGWDKPRSRKRTLCSRDIEKLLDGEELFEAVENDPVYLETCLSEQQREALKKYRQCVCERRQTALQERIRQAVEAEGCPVRKVSPVWKLCVADSRAQPCKNVYMLNIWNPSQDIQSLLKEGCRYKVYQLSTSEGKKLACNTTIQFTATKKTQFQNIQASAEWLCECFQAREVVAFCSLLNPDFQPLCGELDLVGYIILITERQGYSPVVYLVDDQLDFVKVRCFSSLAQQGLEELVKPRALVALTNLQHRTQHSSPICSSIPSLYASDLAMFSTNPKEPHLKEAAAKLRKRVQEQENFFRIAEEKLSKLGHVPSLALPPRTLGLKADAKPDTRTITPHRFVQNTGPFTPLNRVGRNPPTCFSGGDNNKDSKTLKRKRGLDYLCIPTHPPLSPLGTMALLSPRISKTFNPPRRAETPRILKTAQAPTPRSVFKPFEDEWVDDEELAMIDTQALHDGVQTDT
ncbi:breast cancer type 2 susceptibility protein isoform X2 [Esox lucius]|uniref:breast cancer type 2 susceptibility protein isoform X2 n=1 Tax=Esox lucius TaxID=8010 RepID=UPI001476A5D1|nr:breast cancer type 2 susceptibility protein isoform X2 [Esox lucius]